MPKKLLAMLLLCSTSCTMIPTIDELTVPLLATYPVGEAYDDKLVTPLESTAEAVNDKTPLSDIAWQNYFKNETLLTLIDQALTSNRSLKQAAFDIAEAHSLFGIQRSSLFPEITANGSYSRQDFPSGGIDPQLAAGGFGGGGSGPIEFYSANIGISNYEIDFFGRVRSLNESALNEYLSTQAAADAVRIMLIADTANGYAKLKADQALLELSEYTIESQQKAFDLIAMRVEAGIATMLDQKQAEILLQQARADKAAIKRAVAEDVNALRLLLGSPAEMPDFIGDVDVDELEDIAPIIPVGLPSSLLTSRPDIVQAEHALLAANANIGASRAAFFPQINLTAVGGYQSLELDGLIDSSNQFWRLAPSISFPIFTWGRLSNNLELAEIRTDRSIVAYEQTIETAFQEVANALAAVSTYAEQIKAQKQLVKATSSAQSLSELRYQEGIDNYLTVLDSEREYYAAQQNYIRAKAQEVTARINLYRSVGGGLSEPVVCNDSNHENLQAYCDDKFSTAAQIQDDNL